MEGEVELIALERSLQKVWFKSTKKELASHTIQKSLSKQNGNLL
jgi:hypothetical protein